MMTFYVLAYLIYQVFGGSKRIVLAMAYAAFFAAWCSQEPESEADLENFQLLVGIIQIRRDLTDSKLRKNLGPPYIMAQIVKTTYFLSFYSAFVLSVAYLGYFFIEHSKNRRRHGQLMALSYFTILSRRLINLI